MAVIRESNNKDIIQSYIVTTAKYDFSVYEKRIIYRLVEMMQKYLEGKKLDSGFTIEKSLFSEDRLFTLPIASFLNGEEDKNYSRIKKALKDLRNKTLEFDDGRTWQLVGIIEKPMFDRAGWVKFEVQPQIYEALLNFSKGFRKYELKTAMSFDSQYSMRFYELFSGQKTPLTFSIDELKIMFCLEKKYKLTADLIRYVIEPARKELTEKAPYSFTYQPIKPSRSITAIKFFPVYLPQNRDPELEKLALQRKTNLSWDLSPQIRSYLIEILYFSVNEIKNNIELFKEAEKCLPDLLHDLAILKGKAREKENAKGYIINAIKGKLKDINKK